MIKRAIISVSDKTGIVEFASALVGLGVRSEERRVGKECRYRW